MEIISHEFFCFLLFFVLAILLIAGYPVALTLAGVSILIGLIGYFLDLFPNKKNFTEGSEMNLDESPVTESEEKGDVFNLNQQVDDKDLSQAISAISNNIAFSPLESMSGTTQIIDLRTAQDVSGQSGADIGGSSTVVDSEIADLDPERRFSPYESLVRSV